MTTTNETSTHTKVGDGTDTAYAVSIPIFAAGDITVTKVVTATEATTLLVLNVDYTLSINIGIDITITPVAVIPSTDKWVTERALPKTQTVNLVDQGTFPPEAVETALDRLVLKVIDTEAKLERALLAPISDPAGLSVGIGTALARAGNFLKFDDSGNVTSVALDGTSTLTASVFGQTVMDALTAEAADNLYGFYASVIASRPASPGFGTGSRHFATDTFAWSYYDGSAWQDGTAVTGGKGNLLPNGEFLVNQRVGPYTAASAPFTNDDDSYIEDQTILLSDGDDIVDIDRPTLTGLAAGFFFTSRATVQTPSKKFGWLFPLTVTESGSVLGGNATASFSFYAKSPTLTKIRAVLLLWVGAIDAITSDVVSSWEAGGTNPLWATSWSAGNTPSDFAVSSTLTRFTVSDISIGSSVKQVALFIWYNETDANIAHFMNLTGVKINEGSSATPFDHRSYSQSLIDCQAYFQTSFDKGTMPKDNPGNILGALGYDAPVTQSGGALGSVHVNTPVSFFKTPTLVFLNPSATGSGWRNVTAGATLGNAVASHIGTNGFTVSHAAASVTAADQVRLHWYGTALL